MTDTTLIRAPLSASAVHRGNTLADLTASEYIALFQKGGVSALDYARACADRIEQFDALTRLLGRIVGDSVRGATVADTVGRTLDSVRVLVRGKPRPTVVLPVWDSPLLVIGGGSFLSELVSIAGGRNVYDSTSAPSPAVAFEDIVRRDPDFVLVGPESAARLRAQAKWRALRAVRGGKFLIVDTAVVLRPATRLGEGAMSIARLLHPELAK